MSPRLSALNRDKLYFDVNTLSQDNGGHPYDLRGNERIPLDRPISAPTIAARGKQRHVGFIQPCPDGQKSFFLIHSGYASIGAFQ